MSGWGGRLLWLCELRREWNEEREEMVMVRGWER